MKDLGLKVKYGFLNVKFEVITFLVTVMLAFGAFYFFNNPNENLTASILIGFVGLLVIIFLRARDREFYFISLSRAKDKKYWTGQGHFEYSDSQKSFAITNSFAGFIYTRTFSWADYNLNFNFKILHSCLGVIVRAVNLSNCVMLQIGEKGIRPHVFINGGYLVWEIPKSSLSYKKSIIKDQWYKCSIICENKTIFIKICTDKEVICDKAWEIPDGKMEFLFKKDDNNKSPIAIPFPINLEHGTLGVRNWGNEKALVKNVLIKKI